MNEPGPEVVRVVEWNYVDVHVGDGRGLPPQRMAAGPKVMLVRCTKCSRGPWRAVEGRTDTVEGVFLVQGTLVSVYCGTCEQLRAGAVQGLPGFVEAHS